MNHSTTLYTQKVSLSDLNVLAFQLREAGAKFRSTIHKQEATIVFSALPTPALSILETIGKNQEATNRDEESLLAGEGSQSTQEKSLKLDNEETTVINTVELDQQDHLINLKDDQTLESIKESVEPTPEPSSNPNQITDLLATEKQLLKLSKTKLKKLAHQYNIEGRSKLDHHQLVSALANRVPLKNLSGIKNTTDDQLPKN